VCVRNLAGRFFAHNDRLRHAAFLHAHRSAVDLGDLAAAGINAFAGERENAAHDLLAPGLASVLGTADMPRR
jgi:hypothetical protein